MKSEHISLDYQLYCHTSLHFGTGLRQGLIQRGIARDADGFLYVPGSTLKGVLRDHATRLAQIFALVTGSPHHTPGDPRHRDLREFARRSDIVTLIFGSRFRPGTLFFDDARLCKEDRDFFQPPERHGSFVTPQTETRTQVSLSRYTGTARRQLLFSTEYGVPEVRFDGRISGSLSGVALIDGSATYSLLLLLAALRSLEAIGGNKSTGAGRVTCIITQCQVDGIGKSVDDYLALLPEFEYYELAAEEEEES
jgi:CRISPR/Cas system CSM-associated protein Csm3 (group 7 of RAMP superfamily)